MKLRSNLLTLLMIIAMAVTFTSCEKKDGSSNQNTTPQATPETVAADIKVVSFSPSITEILYALGAQDTLVGRTDYCDYPKEVTNIISIGDFYNPDIEKVISLEPDYVLVSALWTEDVATKFKEAGIEVKTFEESNKVEDVYKIITDVAQVVNKTNEAANLINEMKQDLAEVESKVANATAKSVYYVVGYGDYGDYTATGDTYIHDMLTLAGGENIAKDVTGWTYSLEKLIENDPEIIFIGTDMKDDFISNPNYKNLSAVKNNQVYGIDNNLLDRQSSRAVKGVRMLAEIIHPEAFQ